MLIYPTNSENLSLEAIGVLSTMLNVPEYDYMTATQLHEVIPKDSLTSLQKALNELESKCFVIRVGENYAVNKWKIPQMKVI